MADNAARHEPHITIDKQGRSFVNGHDIRVRRVLEALLTFRSIEATAVKMEIGEDYVEAAIAHAVAQIR